MITIEQLSRNQPSETQRLDLRSSKSQKIHKIDSLHRFTHLRELNLANNMITRIENLSCLPHLRILNLEFNQISKLEGLKALTRLEELFLSYNCIDAISAELKCSQGLRVLHLAYNDLKSIEDIRPLSSLAALSVLSLIGNPFLAALNYIAFVKMLVPSLVLLDDRDAGQCVIAANVYPHQEIFILRDALNKLLDQRNNERKNGEGQTSLQIGHSGPKQFSPKRQMGTVEGQNLFSLLQQWVTGYERKAQAKRLEINDLSESYSQCMKKGSAGKAGERGEADLIAKISKYRSQGERGQLSEEGRARLAKLTKQLQKRQEVASQMREQSRSILQMLKSKEGEYAKTRQKVHALKQLREKLATNERDQNKIIISHILYGPAHSQDLDYKDLKRFLYDDRGIIFYLQSLSSIIFGEEADSERIQRLKQFLGDKCLIQIINNLKEVGVRHKKERKRYERERSKLIQQFQTEAQQLCDQWREVQKEKWLMRNSNNGTQFEPHNQSRSLIEERFSIVEAEQRSRIMMLKKDKEHYEAKVDELQQKCEALQAEFQRKYKQLQQFERFFEQFKNERQIVKGLKQQIETASQQLHTKKDLVGELEASIRELSAKEGPLLQKSSFYERKAFQKGEQLKLIEEKLRASQQKCKKVSEEFNLKSYQCIGVQDQIARMGEQLKEYEKKIERQKSTLEIYEEKLRNLSELESNKRSNLATLEADIQLQRRHLSQLGKKVQQSQQKLNRCIETSYQYQLKIQQNKKTLQSLTDINKTVADMMERQSQLKRSIFELEMENEHLQEIRTRMMNEINLKYDDQDQNL